MKNIVTMQNPLLLFLDLIGVTAFFSGLYMNVTEMLKHSTWNTFFTITMSLCGLVYLLMRIYHQFLITKKEKADQGRNKII